MGGIKKEKLHSIESDQKLGSAKAISKFTSPFGWLVCRCGGDGAKWRETRPIAISHML